MGTVANVSTGKPNATGCVYVGATTATLPTSTAATLTGFTNLGFVSEDGVTNGYETESDNIKAWGGDVVCILNNGTTDTFKFKLIEALNSDVLSEIYGNASGSLSAGISVSVGSANWNPRAWVIDMVLKNNVAKRIVIPNGTITEMSEVIYKDDEAIGYEITITAAVDSSSKSHYEYIKGA